MAAGPPPRPRQVATAAEALRHSLSANGLCAGPAGSFRCRCSIASGSRARYIQTSTALDALAGGEDSPLMPQRTIAAVSVALLSIVFGGCGIVIGLHEHGLELQEAH